MTHCREVGVVDIAGPLQVMKEEALTRVSGWIFDAPWLRDFVQTLSLGNGKRVSLIRVLRPGQHIPPHVDRDVKAGVTQRRYQLPLVTHPDVVMSWHIDSGEREPHHLQAGHLYEVDYRQTHEVQNNSSIERVHIQIDVLAEG